MASVSVPDAGGEYGACEARSICMFAAGWEERDGKIGLTCEWLWSPELIETDSVSAEQIGS